jgi:hypothetical protein
MRRISAWSAKWTDAEKALRECLALRAKLQPDAWSTFNTQSMLGSALLGQKKYAEAEALLLAGYDGMKKQQATIPAQGEVRLTGILERQVELCKATVKKDRAAKSRKDLEGGQAAMTEESSLAVMRPSRSSERLFYRSLAQLGRRRSTES